MKTKTSVLVLAALAHESRLAIFRVLVQAGPDGLAAGRISQLTTIAPSSLTFHLKELAHAKLVTSRQQGRFVVYSANFARMQQLLSFLTENCCMGQPCESNLLSFCAPPS